MLRNGKQFRTTPGGANTNKSGLPFEKKTDLTSEHIIILNKNSNSKYHTSIRFSQSPLIYQKIKNKQLFKYMKNKHDTRVNKGHGCKQPDECYVDEFNKIIYIIEKKNQKGGGSVIEKLQTTEFKLWNFRKLFPTYEIEYIYCLGDWFKINCPAELEYLKLKNIPVFWVDDTNFKHDIVNYITNRSNSKS